MEPDTFLSPEESRCLIAVFERIIPADEQTGGATEAEVIRFVDRQLAGFYSRDQSLYRSGVKALQASCSELNENLFEDLDFDEQTAFLEKMESGGLPKEHWESVSSSQFFRVLVDHCMQGFYGSPRHGGNKDGLSYNMMGIDFLK